MSTVAIKNTMVMNNTEKKAGLVERFKKYFLDNAAFFAASKKSIRQPSSRQRHSQKPRNPQKKESPTSLENSSGNRFLATQFRERSFQ